MQVKTESAELAAFREEAATWIEANKDGVGGTVDAFNITDDQYTRDSAFLRKLGAKGWYAPSWPLEYGGGGMPIEKGEIIFEELEKRIPWLESVRLPGDIGPGLATAVWHLGTEEQKRRYIPKILGAEHVTWELYTEPEAGSDLPSLKTQAVRDGDNYVINGTKVFAGGNFRADQYFVMAVTDPQGKRHQNLSCIVVAAETPGVTVSPLVLIGGHRKTMITLDNVVVPVENRIGDEGMGWPIFNLTMRAGHAFGQVGLPAAGQRAEQDAERLLHYASTTMRGNKRIMDLPGPRAALTNLWMETQVLQQWRRRNQQMVESGQPYTWQGSQATLNGKWYGLWLSETIQKVLGPLANVADLDMAPYEGELEYIQRQAIVNTHPGGTCETHKLLMYRGMAAARGYKTARE